MNQQPKPQFLKVTSAQGSTVFVNIHAIRRAEYFAANERGGSMLFLETPGGQATSLDEEADVLWGLLQPLAVEQPAPDLFDMGVTEADFAGVGAPPPRAETVVHIHPSPITITRPGAPAAPDREPFSVAAGLQELGHHA